MKIETPRLCLQLQSPRKVLEWVQGLPEEVKAEISKTWLVRLQNATGPAPWSCMFEILQNSDQAVVGTCGFKGPPDEDGVIEIAYSIEPEFQNRGFATEAIAGLVDQFSRCSDVKKFLAHTKKDNSASQRVLQKVGFVALGEVQDPEDGLVERWKLDSYDT